MKKSFSIALALVMLVATFSIMLTFVGSAEVDDGTITPDTTWYDESQDTYELADAADFYGFIDLLNGKGGTVKPVTFKGKTIKLTADIDLNPGWNAEEFFNNLTDSDNMTIAIPPVNTLTGYVYVDNTSTEWHDRTVFHGTFDGQNHIVSGAYWNQPVRDMGLFGTTCEFGEDIGTTSTVIKNVAFVNSYLMLAHHRQGAIIGVIGNNTTIENVYNGMYMHSNASAQTSGCTAFAGYVAFYDNDDKSSLTMKDCVMDGTFLVQNGNQIAGFVLGLDTAGENFKINLEDCVLSGTIKAPKEKLGHIAGFYIKNKANVNMKNCVMAGTIPEYAYTFGYDHRTTSTLTASGCVYIDGTNEQLVNPVITNSGNTPVDVKAKKATTDNLKSLAAWSTSESLSGYDDWTATIEDDGIVMPISAELAANIKAFEISSNGNDETDNTVDTDNSGNDTTIETDNTTQSGDQTDKETDKVTEKATTTEKPAEKKSGCKSSVVGGVAIVAVAISATAAFTRKKKEQ